MTEVSSAPPRMSKRTFTIIFGVSLATQIGNTGLISVLPPIGRSIGLADEMVVSIFSLSALLWAFTSPRWAAASDRYGRKPLMMVGLAGFMVSMALCGLVVKAGLLHMATPLVIFGAFLVCRALFGAFGPASNPASQAYVAEHTPRERRTQSMASLAGAVGLGQVTGPFLAPLFILPAVGLSGPLFAFALIAAAMLAIVAAFLPESTVPRPQPVVRAPGDAKDLPMWRDERVIPFLIYGFIVATCQTAQQQTLGFLVLDKLHVTPLESQRPLAMAMMFGAVAGLLAQWGLIRMFEMNPRQLLRWGVGVAAAGNLIVALAPDYFWVVAGYAIASLGFGFARPGFTAGASIAVGAIDQARVAGAIAAVNGINVILAPAFMWLYRHVQSGPFLLNMALMTALLVYTFRNPQLRNADPEPATRADATLATLERTDEGA
ncbi:MFS transporter [Phenylobacterium sp.]|uniref:MFS transporter n=1 Tax=Phenylobacterium sp. TaxID=1871053 RepID=UPI0025D5D720|nr:MFS transporter [Phenylobacterium sp.]